MDSSNMNYMTRQKINPENDLTRTKHKYNKKSEIDKETVFRGEKERVNFNNLSAINWIIEKYNFIKESNDILDSYCITMDRDMFNVFTPEQINQILDMFPIAIMGNTRDNTINMCRISRITDSRVIIRKGDYLNDGEEEQ